MARNGSYQTTQFYAGFTSAPHDSTLALGGLQDNSTVIYRGDTAWERTHGGDGGFTGIAPENTQYMLASTQYGRIYVNQEGGRAGSWFWTNRDMYEDGNDVVFAAPFAQSPQRPQNVFAGRTRVYGSTDMGQTWFVPNDAPPLDGNPILSISVSPVDPALVWAATVPAVRRAGVHASSNGGRSWREVTGTLPDRYPVDIVASPHELNVAYVVLSGFGTGHLFRMGRNGAEWEDISAGLPDIPTSAFAIDPFNRDYLYVGNDFGVWFSPDDGATWQPFADGMPTAALVMDLSISPANRSIRAVTHGLGVWERPLVGTPSDGTPGGEVARIVLLQNRPNPFNGVTRITYELPVEARVLLELFNVRGQRIRVLVDQLEGPGFHSVSVNADDLSSGIYFYRLRAAGQVVSRRMLILK